MQPSPLPRLGHYQLLECIGRGGMGLVYRARDMRLERDVAVKCLRTELFEGHYVERFKREATLLAKLNHTHIVQIYDFIEAPDQLALVMELVEGRNLQTHLREHIASISQRLEWLVQITEGLAVAHDAGIIHRDLKAENILINPRNEAKITDLGIAKSQYFNVTITDHVAGSYCSMSPEQAMGEAVTFKSDLFSLGILAYQLLCGAHPFGDTANKLQTMQRIISHPPAPPAQYNPDLPPDLVNLLGQLLSKNPDKRPDNTRWVAAQFARCKLLFAQRDLPGDDTEPLGFINKTPAQTASTTKDHPTFDTRFVTRPTITTNRPTDKFKQYLAANKISFISAAISFVIIAALIFWQLQPAPPRYVAVAPPELASQEMPLSQQALVRGAAYDALQQSLVQLDGYYLIPHDEVVAAKDHPGGKNNLEAIRLATAADEIITTVIQCELEACTVSLSRLLSDGDNAQRLRVQSTKSFDVLADNYLSVATLVSRNIGALYTRNIVDNFQSVEDQDYSTFIALNNNYRIEGARPSMLDDIERLQPAVKIMPSAQRLYREVALDLYTESHDKLLLDKLKNFVDAHYREQDETSLYNLYNLQIVEGDFAGAMATAKQLSTSRSVADELVAHVLSEQGEYTRAIAKFEKSLRVKKTAATLFSLAYAYWRAGNTVMAKQYLDESLSLSPQYHKAHGLKGMIALLNGDLPQAIASFEALLEQKPQDITAANNLGLSYLLTRNYAQAFELFQSAAQTAPHNHTYQINMADAKNLAGEIENSRAIYQHVIASINNEQPVSAQHLRYRSQAYAHIGKIAEALTDLQALEKLDSQNIETIYTAALVHTLAGNTASALLNIEKSLKSGLHEIWFSPNWFNSLCNDKKFIALLNQKQEGTNNEGKENATATSQRNSTGRCNPAQN